LNRAFGYHGPKGTTVSVTHALSRAERNDWKLSLEGH
jgi:hypothetical protein